MVRFTLVNFLKKLKRNPSQGRYIPALDGLRFLAILGVVLFHGHMYFFSEPLIGNVSTVSADRWIEYAIGKGFYGVQLFFIISGFIIVLPFYRHFREQGKQPQFKSYLWRRFKRIEIPYFIALVFGLLWATLMWGGSWSDNLPHFIRGITYTNNVLSENLNPLLPVSWTLELEIQFYLLAPLLAFIFKINKFWVRSIIFATAILGLPPLLEALNIQWPSLFWTKRFILFHLPFFFTGMWCLDTYRSIDFSRFRHWLDLVAISSASLALYLLSFWQTDHYEPIILGIFVIAALTGNWVKRLLSSPLFTIFGGMCYSLYLFHGWILHQLLHKLPIQTQDTPWNHTNILLVTLLVFLVNIPFYLLIEKPFMQQKSKKNN